MEHKHLRKRPSLLPQSQTFLVTVASIGYLCQQIRSQRCDRMMRDALNLIHKTWWNSGKQQQKSIMAIKSLNIHIWTILKYSKARVCKVFYSPLLGKCREYILENKGLASQWLRASSLKPAPRRGWGSHIHLGCHTFSFSDLSRSIQHCPEDIV